MSGAWHRNVSRSTSSMGQLCGSLCPADAAPLCQRWQAQVVHQLGLLWEDHGDLDISPLELSVDRQRQRQEQENERGINETLSHDLPSTVNGLPTKTLILRNLPARVTQDGVLRSLPEPGVAKYNLLHVPQKVKGAPTSGFAFLNFETPQDAIAFFRQWHGRRVQIPMGGTVSSSCVVSIEAAKHQGLVANLMRWRTTMRGLSNPTMLPAVFFGGQRQDFWQYVGGMETFIRGRAIERDGVTYTLYL